MVDPNKTIFGVTAATWDTEDCVGIFRKKNVVDQVELPLSYLIIKKGTYPCIQGDCVWHGDGPKGGFSWEPSVKPDSCCCAITNLPSMSGSNQVLGSMNGLNLIALGKFKFYPNYKRPCITF